MLVALISSISFAWPSKLIQCTTLTFWLIIWLVWVTLLPLLGWVPDTTFFGVFQCSAWIFGFVLFNGNRFPEWLWNNFLRVLWILGLVCAIYALIQLLVKNAMPAGFFASKNTAAAFFMMVDLLLMGKFFTLNHPELIAINQSKVQKTIKNIALLISIYIITFALFAALSRGVILCFIFFAALEIALCRHAIERKNIYQLSAILVLALTTLYLFAQPAIQHRLDLLAHEKSRLVIWEGAWHLWQATPWYGLGIFNFKQYYPAFSLPGDGSNLEYAHNDFLQLLIETGIPGIVILLGIMVTCVAYLRRYLAHQDKNPIACIQGIACFAALGSLVCHSFIDFNFYVFPMNLLIGCCLGYLYYFFKKEGCIRIYSLSSGKSIWILQSSLVVFLLLISSYFIRFLILEHYIGKTEAALQAKQFRKAVNYSNHALKSFHFVEIQSLQIDAYLQLIQQTTSDYLRRYWTEKAVAAINQTIIMNPYFAHSYFQMALLQSLILNEPREAEKYFLKTLKNNPHYCLARLTFVQFLIGQNELQPAQEVLEAGLHYPIPPEYIELYLNYLAKLRFKNGDQEGAKKAAERLQHLIVYNQDYSDLL
ncbi:Lipid A core - O-antigen ligase and related enzymes [Legionella bozemanae]|uniref:O-Antigen ligase n=2 Tax=Legionella bozemanae TaxID=447 RepID=A0A0W0RZ72_LEGBO|nr:O-Antigen ligase [Legionella bozemanae]STO32491.1 Lipid A core - O-antigen ligase and related enzymes [Legionella bozemanae]